MPQGTTLSEDHDEIGHDQAHSHDHGPPDASPPRLPRPRPRGRCLAQPLRLAPPLLQVNIAKRQVNVAGACPAEE